MKETMKKMIRRIGTFNWGAGVWWGDAEAYFLYVWLGTSMLENVTLDYYLYASSCENSGVQCGMLSGDDCTGCYARTAWDANPFQESCSNKGINGVYDAVKTKSAQELYEQLLGVLNSEGHLFDQF